VASLPKEGIDSEIQKTAIEELKEENGRKEEEKEARGCFPNFAYALPLKSEIRRRIRADKATGSKKTLQHGKRITRKRSMDPTRGRGTCHDPSYERARKDNAAAHRSPAPGREEGGIPGRIPQNVWTPRSGQEGHAEEKKEEKGHRQNSYLCISVVTMRWSKRTEGSKAIGMTLAQKFGAASVRRKRKES